MICLHPIAPLFIAVLLREGEAIPPNKARADWIRVSWQWHIFHKGLSPQYRLRWGVSLPCSGWERVVPPRSNHQETIL